MKVPELRRRILFTLAMIVVVRLGVQIPLPGIDVMELQKVIEASANASGPGAGLATVLTIFSGGGLQQCGIFALGIMPYISASIMTQLLSAVVPQWAKMVREEGGLVPGRHAGTPGTPAGRGSQHSRGLPACH